MEGTLETKKIDTPTQFEWEVWYKPSSEVWKPINTTPQKLAELKEDMKNITTPEKRAEKAAEFIKANQALSDTSVVAPLVATGVVGATVSDTISDSIKDVKKTFLKDLGFFGMLFVDPKTLDPKDVADEVKSLIEKKKSWGFFDKVFSSFQLHFLLGKAKKGGINLSEHLSAEEKKIIGLTDTVTNEPKKNNNQDSSTKPEKVKEIVNTRQSDIIARHLINRNNSIVLTGFWNSIGQWVRDGTYGADEKKAKEEIMQKAGVVLSYVSVREKSFSELVRIYKSWNIEGFGITDKKELDALRLALKSLSDNEDWMNKHLSPIDSHWKNDKLGETLDSFYTRVGFDRIQKLQWAIADIDWKDTLNTPKKLASMIVHPKQDWTGFDGIFADKFDTLKNRGVDAQLFVRIIENQEWESSISDYRSVVKQSPFKNEESQKFIEEISKNNGFPQWVMKLMNDVGLWSHTASFGNWELLTIREVFTLYAITWGETNMAQMTPDVKTGVIMALYGIIWRQNPWALTAETFMQLAQGTQNPHMQEILEFTGSQINKATYVAVLTSLGTSKEAIEWLDVIREKNPTVFYATIGGIMLACGVGLYTRSVWVTGWIITAIIVAAGKIAWLSIAGGAVWK